MNRDSSVTISLIALFGGLLLAVLVPPLRGLWTFVMFLAGIRLFVLWFQTLIHAVKNSEVGWVIGHVIFGNLVSLIYFYSRQDSPTLSYEKRG